MLIDVKKVGRFALSVFPYAAALCALYLGYELLSLSREYDQAAIDVAIHQAKAIDHLALGVKSQ